MGDARMSQEKHYEMQWDCQFCGTKQLLGKTHRFCPTCGAPQNPESRYFPPDSDKVAVEDHELVGADVTCPACGGLNAGSAVHCGNCGASLEGGEQAGSITGDRWTDPDAIGEKYYQSRDVMHEKHERDMAAAGVTTPAAASAAKRRPPKNRRGGIIIGAVIAAIVGLIALGMQTNDVDVVVSGHEWERTIQIEEYKTLREGSWQNSVPSSSRNRRCYEKQSGTNRIPDGEDCRTVRRDNGDGTFSERQECTTRYREEPVYDTWCDYDIDRWVNGRVVRTSGDSLRDTPYWGDADLRCTGQRVGCEREGNQNEQYTVMFRGDGNTYRCTYRDEQEWASIPIESAWTLPVYTFGGAACDDLERR
jgi:hypothetical protein